MNLFRKLKQLFKQWLDDGYAARMEDEQPTPLLPSPPDRFKWMDEIENSVPATLLGWVEGETGTDNWDIKFDAERQWGVAGDVFRSVCRVRMPCYGFTVAKTWYRHGFSYELVWIPNGALWVGMPAECLYRAVEKLFLKREEEKRRAEKQEAAEMLKEENVEHPACS